METAILKQGIYCVYICMGGIPETQGRHKRVIVFGQLYFGIFGVCTGPSPMSGNYHGAFRVRKVTRCGLVTLDLL